MDMSITDTATILGGIAAVAGFCFGLWEFRRKTDLKLFRTYTEKYNQIITPEMHDRWNRACNSNDPKDWKDLDHVAIAFFNLVWEEIYLHRAGLLRDNIWKIWKPEIESVLQTDFAEVMMEKHQFTFLKTELKTGLR